MMNEISVIRDLVTIFGVIAGFSYYVLTVRNNQKSQRISLRNQELALETRQASILMNLYSTFRSPEFVNNWDHVVFRFEYTDWEDAFNKIHPVNSPEERTIWFSTGMYFEGLGVLVKRGLIDLPLVDHLLGNLIMMTWEKMGPVEKESRVRLNNETVFDDFEYLYNEILSYRGLEPGSTLTQRERVKHYAGIDQH